MTENIIKQEPKSRSKALTLVKVVIGFLILGALLFLIVSVLSTEQDVNSLNAFLSNSYGVFLLFRMVIYVGVIIMCIKMNEKIKPTPYYKTFKRTCYAGLLFIIFNEVMLYIRLMG